VEPNSRVDSTATSPAANKIACLALEADLEERAAIAQHEGGIPAIYALPFAEFQLRRLANFSEARWQRSLDDLASCMDQHGYFLARAGWSFEDVLRFCAASREEHETGSR